MVFENGVKYIQAAAYNGARTVHSFETKNLALYLLLRLRALKEQQRIFHRICNVLF